MRTIQSEEFYKILKQSSEGQQYLEIVEKAKHRKELGDQQYEKHHIHPRKLGGSLRDKDNLVLLTLYEHCLVHVLLAKALPCPETLCVVNRMSGKQFKYLSNPDKVTLDEIYEWSKVREKGQNLVKEANKARAKDSQFRQKLSDSKKGKVCITKDGEDRVVSKEDLDKFLSQGWKSGRAYVRSKESNQKISEAKRGRIWIHLGEDTKLVLEEEFELNLKDRGWQRGISSQRKERLAALNRKKAQDPAFRQRLSEATKKAHETIPDYNARISRAMKNHVRSAEHVQKLHEAHIRNSADVDRNRRIAETLRNKITITDGTHNKHVNPEELESWTSQGWYRGFVRRKNKE